MHFDRARRLALFVPTAALMAHLTCLAAALAETAPTPPAKAAAPDLRARAEQLAKDLLIVDTHVDVPYRLTEKMEDVGAPAGGDFDYPRAVAGGLDAPFMSIYVPASYQHEKGKSKRTAQELIDLVEKIVLDHPKQFALARTPDDLLRNQRAGLISLPLGMENGSPIEDDLANLDHFFDHGIRYITLTHSEDNAICDSSYSPPETRKWKGLSPFGRQVVARMNTLGVLVDVSHVSDQAFEQILEASAAPVLATHSSARHFTPGFERNMSDDMIRKMAAKGGVIHINFGSTFLTAEANAWSIRRQEAIAAFNKEKGVRGDSPESTAFAAQWLRENPLPYADVKDVVAHIDHVVKLVGIDHVGLGSDFDGVGDSLPTGLKSVADYPNLFRLLLEKGYSDADIEKIASGNLLRLWRQAEAIARRDR